MERMTFREPLIGVTLCLALAGPVGAQPAPTLAALEAQLERAEDVTVAAGAAATMKDADRELCERTMQDLEDELGYVRVKSKRGEPVTGAERRALAGRLEGHITRTQKMLDALAAAPPERSSFDLPLHTLTAKSPVQFDAVATDGRVYEVRALMVGPDVALPSGTVLRLTVDATPARRR